MLITNPRALAPYFDLTQTVRAIALTDSVVAEANPDRVALSFVGQAAGTVILRPGVPATATLGFTLTSPNHLDFFFADWGGIVGREWHGITAGAGFSILVIESIFRPFR